MHKQFKEFGPVNLKIRDGKLPQNLNGVLYRNCVASFDRKGELVQHLFDGDGSILAVNFKQNQATANYKFIWSPQFKEEHEKNEFIYAQLNKQRKGNLFQRIFQRSPKKTSNTNVLKLEDKIWALMEGQHPYILEPDNLKSIGFDNFKGSMKPYETYSAHYKIDPSSNTIINFGNIFTGKNQLNMFENDRKGNLIKKKTVLFEGETRLFNHDFCFAGKYLVFILPPIFGNLKQFIFGKEMIKSLDFRPEKGVQIAIIDRNTFELVSQSFYDARMIFHFSNGFVNKEGNIVVEFCEYSDTAKIFQYFENVVDFKSSHSITGLKGSLSQLIINPQNASVLSYKQIIDKEAEFPVYDGQRSGQEWNETFFTLNDRENTTYEIRTIGKYSKNNDTLIQYQREQSVALQEPVLAPNDSQGNGYILSLGVNDETGNSELHILNSINLKRECVLEFPENLPISFHGSWDPKI